MSPSKPRFRNPILLLSILLSTFLLLPPLPPPPAPRNGPLLPSAPKPRATSSYVFSPRTPREHAYLSKPFVQDFLSLAHASRVYISNRPPFGYCKIPGTVDDTVTGIFQRARIRDVKEFDHDYVTRVLRDDRFPKFVIVRNPMIRTLVAFMKVIEDNRIPANRHEKAFHAWVNRLFPSERSFTAEELNRLEEGVIPQHINCGMHKARLFKVFKYEDKPGLDRFLEMVGVGAVGGVTFPDLSMEVLYKFYNGTDVFDRVKRFCKRDIDVFEYGAEVERLRELVLERERTG